MAVDVWAMLSEGLLTQPRLSTQEVVMPIEVEVEAEEIDVQVELRLQEGV